MANVTPNRGANLPLGDDFEALLAQAPAWSRPLLKAVEAEAADWARERRSGRDEMLHALSRRTTNHRVQALALGFALLGMARGMEERQNPAKPAANA
jgi:hypothetical protein